jgi:hypothetical protein
MLAQPQLQWKRNNSVACIVELRDGVDNIKISIAARQCFYGEFNDAVNNETSSCKVPDIFAQL